MAAPTQSPMIVKIVPKNLDKKNDRKPWGEGETLCLINLYKKARVDVKVNRRKRIIYESIAQEMSKEKFYRTANEIKKKIENLNRQLKTEKGKIGPSGGAPSAWKYYEVFQNAVGYLPSLDSSLLVESIYSDDDFELNNQSQSSVGPRTSAEVVDMAGPCTSAKVTDMFRPSSSAEVTDMLSIETIEVDVAHVPEEKEKPKEFAKQKRGAKKNSVLKDLLLEFQKAESQSRESDADLRQILSSSVENDREIINLMKEQNKLLQDYLNKK